MSKILEVIGALGIFSFLGICTYTSISDKMAEKYNGNISGREVKYYERKSRNEMKITDSDNNLTFLDIKDANKLGNGTWTNDFLEIAWINSTYYRMSANSLDSLESKSVLTNASRMYNEVRSNILKIREIQNGLTNSPAELEERK